MKRLFYLALLAAGLLGPAGACHARPLSPMEKAWKAICDRARAEGDTMTAQACALYDSSGNSRGALALARTGPPSALVNSPAASVAAAAGQTQTAEAALPPDPLGFRVSPTAEEILLSWSNTPSAKGFWILKARGEEPLASQNTVLATINTYRDTTVTPQAGYRYQIVAQDIWGNTRLASRVLTASLVPSQPPSPPADYSVSSEDERVRLQWKPGPRTSHDLKGYWIYRTPLGSETRELVNVTPVAKTDYSDSQGVLFQKYQYQVQAVDTWGNTGEPSIPLPGFARPRSRSSLILASTAYRGLGRQDENGFTGDLQFAYYIGTLYGQQDPELSKQALYLDPISLWLLLADLKYTLFTESQFPLSVAAGAKGGVSLFAGQQSSSGGSFTFSDKSQLNPIWGGYVSFSRSLGNWGVHGGYLRGTFGDTVFFLSKYLEAESGPSCFYAGTEFPLARRMNVALEVLYPLDAQFQSRQHPCLVNLHVDRLFNFDIGYLHWDRGWAVLGYFNLRFTLFPGS